MGKYHEPWKDKPAAGPFPSLADRPNLDQVLRSATRGLTTSRCVVKRIRRVVLTFLPLSSNRHVTMVLVPSLFEVWVSGGSSLVVSSSSSSSAQSGRLQGSQAKVQMVVAEERVLLC
jgi:hypothetical protein